MAKPEHLMTFEGQTVAVMHVRIQLPDGSSRVVPMDELSPIAGLKDLGLAEGERYIKLLVEGKELGPGMEVNGVWPEDIPRLLRQALTWVEVQQAMTTPGKGEKQ